MLSEGTPRTGAALWRWVGVLVLLVAAAPIVHRYLIAYPDDQWQVDLEVYREAGRSLLLGRPVYTFETEVPQLLPFTYPTFSAVLSIPLALLPWAVVQYGGIGFIVWAWRRPMAAGALGLRIGDNGKQARQVPLTHRLGWKNRHCDQAGIKAGEEADDIMLVVVEQ